METDGYDNRGAGANLNTDDDISVTFLPLVDSERKLLQIHFLSAQEVTHRHTHRKRESMLMYIYGHHTEGLVRYLDWLHGVRCWELLRPLMNIHYLITVVQLFLTQSSEMG